MSSTRLGGASVLLLTCVGGSQLFAGPMVRTSANCGGTEINYVFMNPMGCSSSGISTGAQYGVAANNEQHLGAFATINVAANTPFKSAASVQTGEFISFNHEGGPGTYLVSLDFTLSGTIPSRDPSQWPSIQFTFYPDWVHSTTHDTWTSGGGTWTGSTTHVFHSTPFQFTTGVDYGYVFEFTVTANGTAPAGAAYSAVMDYMHSAAITGGKITNLDGSAPTGITYSTAGGSMIPLDNGTQVQVPEPSALLLIPAGLALLAWRRSSAA
jgi:hypothetical protein